MPFEESGEVFVLLFVDGGHAHYTSRIHTLGDLTDTIWHRNAMGGVRELSGLDLEGLTHHLECSIKDFITRSFVLSFVKSSLILLTFRRKSSDSSKEFGFRLCDSTLC